MKLNHSQKVVLNTALSEARRFGATPRETKALVEALIVESNISNPKTATDHDSLGALQQRPSQGWMHSTNVKLATRDFLKAARQIRGTNGSAGVLAQSVQRSAYPDRYQQQGGNAASLLGATQAPSKGSGGRRQGATSASVAQAGSVDPRRAALAAYLQEHDPNSVILKSGALNVPSSNPQVTPGRQVPLQTHAAPGTASHTLRQGMSPLKELFWQGPQGINAKNGVKVPQGFVDGHTDHVHVAAGPQTVVQLGKIAQHMGLNVGENPHFGGVHPVHVNGSYHYKNEAIDVSGAVPQMQHFAHYVAHLYGIKVH